MEWKEQVEAARSANLADYFLSHGYECELKRDELHVKNYGGLFVNVNTGGWYCFSENKGGTNAVNCLTEMLGMDFKTAVTELSGTAVSVTRERENNSFSSPKKELEMPEKAENMKKVFAYLCKTRGILILSILLYTIISKNRVFLEHHQYSQSEAE